MLHRVSNHIAKNRRVPRASVYESCSLSDSSECILWTGQSPPPPPFLISISMQQHRGLIRVALFFIISVGRRIVLFHFQIGRCPRSRTKTGFCRTMPAYLSILLALSHAAGPWRWIRIIPWIQEQSDTSSSDRCCRGHSGTHSLTHSLTLLPSCSLALSLSEKWSDPCIQACDWSKKD